jgi:hypothetical protein
LPKTTRPCANGQRVVQRAPHQRGRLHAVGEPRPVDHFGHLDEAAIEPPDRVGERAFELDLARRHRARAELVLEANDPVAVRCAVIEQARHQEQADAACPRRRAVGRASSITTDASAFEQNHFSPVSASDRSQRPPSSSVCRRPSRLPSRS